MDIYSFGLLSCWLLFDEAQDFENRGLNLEGESPLTLARRLTARNVESDSKLRHSFLELFEKTLAEETTIRSSQFEDILPLLSPDR